MVLGTHRLGQNVVDSRRFEHRADAAAGDEAGPVGRRTEEHLAAIVFVALEALLGYSCPLTLWEDALRGGLRSGSFVGRWVQRALYYNAPAWVFTVLYVAWAAASAITLYFVPARRRAS